MSMIMVTGKLLFKALNIFRVNWVLAIMILTYSSLYAESDWIKFRNEEQGFSFSHPSSWEVFTDKKSNVLSVSSLPLLHYDQMKGKAVELRVFVLDNQKKKSLDTFFMEDRRGGKIFIPRKITRNNGLEVLRVGYHYDPPAWGVIRYEIQTMVPLTPIVNLYMQIAATGQLTEDDLNYLTDKISSSLQKFPEK